MNRKTFLGGSLLAGVLSLSGALKSSAVAGVAPSTSPPPSPVPVPEKTGAAPASRGRVPYMGMYTDAGNQAIYDNALMAAGLCNQGDSKSFAMSIDAITKSLVGLHALYPEVFDTVVREHVFTYWCSVPSIGPYDHQALCDAYDRAAAISLGN